MKEDLLYYLWRFQKFESEDLKTSEGEILKVIHPGYQNNHAGPDFFNARIQIEDQLWAGNVEIHVRASDWYFHQHETDPNYDNVILHVVWEHDVEVYRKDNSGIAALELKTKVAKSIIDKYDRLLNGAHLILNCENDFPEFSHFQVEHWLERLYFERLEERSVLIWKLLEEKQNNWEAVLFLMLAKSFGLNVNSEVFLNIAQSIDFSIVQKQKGDQFSLESLFLGQAGLIKDLDNYGQELQARYEYLAHKYSLENKYLRAPEFFRLRPDNFPTIRLAQFSALYSQKINLFQDLIHAKDLQEIYNIFKIEISDYWRGHYNFGKSHAARNKVLTNSFIDLLVINCIVPLRYCYSNYLGKDEGQLLLELLGQIKPEKNKEIDLFNELRPKTARNALHTQALLQLRRHYCNMNKCLQCDLGASLLKKSPKYI